MLLTSVARVPRKHLESSIAAGVLVATFGLASHTSALSRPGVDTTTTTVQSSTTIAATTSTVPATTSTTLPVSATTIPQGCPPAPTAIAVFVGVLRERDDITGTFDVVQVRAGSLEGYATGTSVRVRYGTDVKFLETGSSYLVGVNTDAASLVLSSSVRPSAELFGGAAVAGAVNGGKDCPTFEDPARTLHVDGTSVDSGVLTAFFGATSRLVLALVVPPVLVLAGLVALVLWRRTVNAPVRRR